MPIDPSIALGVRPVEQPNVLGQMAQVMAMRQAQQEYENEGGLRNALTGGLPDDPSGLLRYGKQGRAVYESAIKGRKEKLESDDKRNVMLGGLAGPVMENPTLENFKFTLDRAEGFGLITPTQKQEVLAQYGGSPESIKAYASQIFKGSITAQAQQSNATLIANNQRTVGASYYGHNVSRDNSIRTDERERARGDLVPVDNGFGVKDIYGNVTQLQGYGNFRGPNAVSAAAVGGGGSTLPPANGLLMTMQPTATNLNGLRGGAPSQPGAPTVANAAAIQQQQNIPRPPARAGYQYDQATGRQVRIPQTGLPEGLKLRPGERWNETNQSVEQVPGSALYIEQQKKHGADLNAVNTVQATTKWGTGRIDKILDPKNKTGFENNFGGFTAYGTKEFSGNTALVKSELDSLKSDLKNRGLQLFRTGGSIGAMTEKEWPIVESMLATLTPKMNADDARAVLREVRAKFEALENLAAEKYNDQWQNTQYHKTVETSGGGGSAAVPQAAIDMLKSNPALKDDFDAKYGAGASKRYLGR